MATTTTPAPLSRTSSDLVSIQDLVMHFPITQGIIIQRKVGAVRAVDGVSLSIPTGGTLGLVGESGSGKSTIGRCIVRLYKPTGGRMFLGEQDLARLEGGQLRTLRRRVQMVFQDPYASLNPRYTIGSLIAEPMFIHKTGTRKDIRQRTEELLDKVGLNPNLIDRYPHEFSGGQRQRIAIARAISTEPEFIIADEPVSALDSANRVQVLELLKQLRSTGVALVFISHDLGSVAGVADRIAVLYRGELVESGPARAVITDPQHAYTRLLVGSAPTLRSAPASRAERDALRALLPA